MAEQPILPARRNITITLTHRVPDEDADWREHVLGILESVFGKNTITAEQSPDEQGEIRYWVASQECAGLVAILASPKPE